MILSDFITGLKRVEGVFGEVPKAVIDELKRGYMKESPLVWDAMCTHVINHSKFAPKPAQFNEAYQAVATTIKPQAESSLHPAWVPSAAEIVRRNSPRAARNTLALISRRGTDADLPRDFLDALLERAGADGLSDTSMDEPKPEPEPAPPPPQEVAQPEASVSPKVVEPAPQAAPTERPAIQPIPEEAAADDDIPF